MPVGEGGSQRTNQFCASSITRRKWLKKRGPPKKTIQTYRNKQCLKQLKQDERDIKFDQASNICHDIIKERFLTEMNEKTGLLECFSCDMVTVGLFEDSCVPKCTI